MFNIDHWQEIFISIKQNKLRTFLSGFTITLGLFIFIMLFGLGNGLKNGFTRIFIHDAENQISFIPGRATEIYLGLQSNRTSVLKNKDINFIKEKYDDVLVYKTATISQTENVSYKTESGLYSVQATYPEKQHIEKIIITSGRFITKQDMDNKFKFAAIGRLVEKDLFKNKSAIGQYLTVGKINYKVIGVFQSKKGDNEERIIYIPITAIQSIKKNSDTVNQINVTYIPTMKPNQAIKLGKDIEKDLRSRLKISSSDKTALFVRNSAETMKNIFAYLDVISFFIMFIGSGTITAGIIGISNIMVYTVKERTKEIGIRKALGARPSNIVWLILQESIFITSISGILGVSLGTTTLHLIKDSFTELFIVDPSVSWNLIIYSAISLITFGIIAGFIPSRQAAKIKPIDALNTE
ncbi:MAG: ABC transporter permease [Flavobacteriaceae bacterium]|jgi:putative ABC transport system permease protein|nr:ABC transporter permease [Flavobacteriaceae bacterium]